MNATRGLRSLSAPFLHHLACISCGDFGGAQRRLRGNRADSHTFALANRLFQLKNEPVMRHLSCS
jgi:hypothetical protein